MSDGHSHRERRQRCAKRAGSIALNEHQVWTRCKPGEQRFRDCAGVTVRVVLAGTFEPFRMKGAKSELRGIEVRVLARQDQRWPEAPLGERIGNRGQLDCFGSGADDQPDFRGTQPSP
jgi:hypothetical protein